MNDIERNIISGAKKLNACSLLKDEMSANELLALAFSPQGWEFCRKHSFPRLADVRALYGKRAAKDGTFAVVTKSCTAFYARTCRNILVAGDVELNIYCDDGAETYHVLAMHGARVAIYASNYAVVHTEEIGHGCTIEFINEDNTSVRL